LRRMRASDAEIAFKPWIYEIAKNACIDAFRRSRRAEEVSFDDDDGPDRIQLVSADSAPDAAFDTRLKLDHLRGAFDGLSDAHHQILVMRELAGLSYREIGERLGMSQPSVESTLFRARRRLTEEYEELVSGERCVRVQAIIAAASEGSLGVRDERRMARHVAHCQPCRRAALAAGLDVATLARRTVRAKIAALLPLPSFLKRRLAGPDGLGALGGKGGTVAQWSSLAQYAEPTWAKAAAVAAAVAVAGLGVGVAERDGGTTGRAPAAAPPAKASGADRAPARTAPAAAGPPSVRQRSSGHGSRSRAGSTSGSSAGGASSTTHSSGPSSPTSASSTGSGAKQSTGGGNDAGKQAGETDSKPTASTGGGSTAGGPTAPDPSGAVGGVSKTVNDAAGTVTKTVDDAAGGVTNTVNGTVDGATGVVDQTTHAVTGTVDQATGGSLQGATNTAQGALDGATATASGTTQGATSTVDQTVSGATDTVDQTVQGVTGGLTGGR
jgi:RNA polymerase sigma factor (sigma-70 family)